MWVFDAIPLIYLAKVERLGLLGHLAGPREIPERVYAEVLETGLEEGYPDARRVERQVEEGTFEVVSAIKASLFDRLRENDDLSEVDASVLARADQEDGTAILDET